MMQQNSRGEITLVSNYLSYISVRTLHAAADWAHRGVGLGNTLVSTTTAAGDGVSTVKTVFQWVGYFTVLAFLLVGDENNAPTMHEQPH